MQIDSPTFVSDSGLSQDLPILPGSAWNAGVVYLVQLEGRLVINEGQVGGPGSSRAIGQPNEIDEFWASAEQTTAPWVPDTDEERAERSAIIAAFFPLQAAAVGELEI